MNNLNIVGRLAQDPKLTISDNNTRIWFVVAVDGPNDRTDWLPVTTFGAQAEAIAEHLQQGSLVAVTGRIQSGRYQKDGQTVHDLQIIGSRVDFLARPRNRAGVATGNGGE